jgi:hypothetical protein
MKISKSQLIHYQLQAWMRENKCDDLEYLGLHNGEHYYRIGIHKVPVSYIERIDSIQ